MGGGALTSCIWALKSAHEDNWKDCIITWATACGGEHTAHLPWSGTDSTQQPEDLSHQHSLSTHTDPSYIKNGFSTLGLLVSLRLAARSGWMLGSQSISCQNSLSCHASKRLRILAFLLNPAGKKKQFCYFPCYWLTEYLKQNKLRFTFQRKDICLCVSDWAQENQVWKGLSVTIFTVETKAMSAVAPLLREPEWCLR